MAEQKSDRDVLVRTLAEALTLLREVNDSRHELLNLEMRVQRFVDLCAAELGVDAPRVSELGRRERGAARQDLEACAKFLRALGRPAHVDMLLSQALQQDTCLRNKNRLTAALFSELRKGNSVFTKAGRGYFGLREFAEAATSAEPMQGQ